MSLQIRKPGLATSVQDLGRWGFQSQGVPIGGAMDECSMIHANMLVGNEIGKPCLEFMMGDSEIKFLSDSLIALVGKGSKAFIDEIEIPFGKAVRIANGSTLIFKHSRQGVWKYLAVGGGFLLDKILGSYSTYLPDGFGGLDGRYLKWGDELLFNHNKSAMTKMIEGSLTIGTKNFCVANWGITKKMNTDDHEAAVLIYAGNEWDWLSESEKETLLDKPFRIEQDSNRMGYRLTGEKMERTDNRELTSTAVTTGTIQLTNEGKLIVLMADAQTVGGYPRVAQVAAVNIPKLSQKRVGEEVRFKMISFAQAEDLFLNREKERQEIVHAIRTKFSK